MNLRQLRNVNCIHKDVCFFNGIKCRESICKNMRPECTCKNVTKHYAYGFKCSLCDFEQYDGNTLISFDYEYCPSCGAKVVI